MQFERVSLEMTNRCAKACSFCYNHSAPQGATSWTGDEVVALAEDLARHGTKALSLGGGEPLQHEDTLDVLRRLDGILFRSLTTNGLPLLQGGFDELVSARPDKVHVSLHFPERDAEVERVIGQVQELHARGVSSGINLLVARSKLDVTVRAATQVRAAGIGNDRIVYLPMRGSDTPSGEQIARVAGGVRFQSMSCLLACGRSERFCSIGWDKTAAWCSYTSERRKLESLTHEGLVKAMTGLGLQYCGVVNA